MLLVPLLSSDAALAGLLAGWLSEERPDWMLLPLPPGPDAANALAALGGLRLILADLREAPAPARAPAPVLRLLPADATPDGPSLVLPPRKAEFLSLLALMSDPAEPAAAASPAALRLEALGRFHSGLAHDLNNCLTTILGNLILLPELAPELADMTRDMEAAAQKASTLLRLQQTFYRRDVMPPHPVNLTLVLREVHDLAARLVGPRTRLGWLLPDEALHAEGDEGDFERIVLGLLADVPAPLASLSLDATAHDIRLRLEPAPAANEALAATLARLGGRMEENVGGLSLLFPRLEPEVLPPPPLPGPPAAPRLLLAEGHPNVRRVLAAGLAALGYQVTVAADTDEVARITGTDPVFSHVLLDADLPGGGAERLSRLHGLPENPLWTLAGLAGPSELPKNARFARKPLTAPDLHRLLAGL
jgi:CheY-like chemotaxis protein